MIKILDEIFADVLDDYGTKYVGNKIYIKLDDNRRIELSFYNTHAVDTYNSISLRLVHKINGSMHGQTIEFKDIFYSIQDLSHPNKIGKHIWYNKGAYNWYGKPTKEDIEALQEVVTNYIEVWK